MTDRDHVSSGARIVREASSVLARTGTGSLTELLEPLDLEAGLPDGEPVRQSSQSQLQDGQFRDDIIRQLEHDVATWVAANIKCVVGSVLLLVAGAILMFVLFALAVFAVVLHFKTPCDQPLNLYLVLSFVVGRLLWRVQQYIPTTWSGKARVVSILVLVLPKFIIVVWGFYMVDKSMTCPETNPGLFYPTRRYIYAQIFVTVFAVVSAIVSLFSMRRILLVIASLTWGNGCEDAVAALPTVQIGSSELISDDGKPLACTICLEELTDQKRPPVRTHCRHYYHRDCLATWCVNRITCPMCREPIPRPRSNDAAEITGTGAKPPTAAVAPRAA